MTLEDLRTSLFNKHTVGFEDRGWSHKLRNAGGLKKLKKAKQRILLYHVLSKHGPCAP